MIKEKDGLEEEEEKEEEEQEEQEQEQKKKDVGWLVVLRFKATLTAKVISWRSVMHMCFLACSHQY